MQITTWVTGHLRAILIAGIALIFAGIAITPLPGRGVASTIVGVIGMLLFAVGTVAHARRSRTQWLRLVVVVIVTAAAALLLVPASARPKGILLVPAALLVLILLVGWRRL